MSERHHVAGFSVAYIPAAPAQWILKNKEGAVLGIYKTRSELRFAAKTARLAEMCNESAKARGAFQPYVV